MSESSFPNRLVSLAKQHIEFLQRLHSHGVTLEGSISRHALERYTGMWLPLVASELSRGTKPVPPMDIAWLWHCHRLAPLRYEDFCIKEFGKVLEADPAFMFQTIENTDEATLKAWTVLYPDEPFFGGKHTSGSTAVSQLDLVEKLDGFDLVSSVKAQATFLWQVLGPNFQKDSFLLEGAMNYNKFLTLSRLATDFLIVPTYQIDLMWHTHMLASIDQYNKDCLEIRGTKLHHDDSLTDRTPGATLDESFRKTEKLWQHSFGEQYAVEGGMYRGEPPEEYFRCREWSPTTKTSENSDSCLANLSTGATSSGSAWLDPRIHPTAFERPYPRGRGLAINLKRPGAVYGRGVMGYGYYSFQTRDAYEIMNQRLAIEKIKEINREFVYDCCSILNCGLCDSPSRRARKQEIRDRISELNVMIAIVEARMESASPDQKLSVEQIEKRSGTRVNREDTYTDPGTGFVYYSMSHTVQACCNAAGCGAKTATGSACGGAACGGGGAACGGGACGGGGGCGGGGCGGG